MLLQSKHGNKLCLSAFLLVCLSGCKEDSSQARGDAASGALTAEAAAFDQLFQLQDSILLEQPDSAPIVRISGIDRDSLGRIVIADVSEGNVKLFGPDGRLLRVIGRKGRGPGEFQGPRYPRFGPGGLIYVADAQDPRVQAFDTTGALVSATRIEGAGVVMGFEPLAADRFLLTVERASNARVLLEMDTAGTVLREFLNVGEVKPTGEKDYPLWRNVRSYFLTVSGDTAYVSSSISDTLWTVHLGSGREGRQRLAFAGYERPTPPGKLPPGIQGLMEWSRSFHSGSTLSADGESLFWPFVKGVLNNGDPMLLLARTESRWRVVSGAPPLIGAGGGRAIGILSPGEADVRLGLYTLRTGR